MKNKKGEKRAEIIKHAENIFSQKGNQAKISEIASAAGIRDSVLYYHFKNKEDLLFSTVGEGLKKTYELLLEQLSGIRDPSSRLSKMLWFQINYHEKHTDYANLLLFESRSNSSFSLHPAFNYINKWSDIGRDIITDGISKGVFKENLDIDLMRDILFGLVDMLNIQNLISNVKSSSPENFDDILDIILPMVEKDKPADKLSFDRKQSISKAAESVFAEFGYKNATISAIARKAKISEGNIYEHFKNKKNLLINGIEEQIQSTINFIDDLSKKNNSERQLRDFMLFFSIPYLKRPDALKTLIYSAMYNKIFYQSSAFKTFTKLFDRMDTMLIDGKETGTFRKEINPRIIKNIFLGAFCHLTLRWDCQQQGAPTYRLEKINLLIDMICKAIS